MTFDSLGLILAKLASKVHFVVSLVAHQGLIFGARLHMHVPVGAEPDQVRGDNGVFHGLLLVLEHVLADASVRLS